MDNNNNIYYTKTEKMNKILTNNLKGFLQLFCRPRCEEETRGGRRLNEDQNAYDSVMTAMISNDLTRAKLGRMFSRQMQVSYRAVKRARGMRKDMEDMDSERWIRRPSVVPKDSIGVGEFVHLKSCLFGKLSSRSSPFSYCYPILSSSEHKAAISELLHSNEFSRIDNTDKTHLIVDVGQCPTTGARIYDLYPRRELIFDDQEILDELKGRNRANKNNPNPPHPVWTEVKRATTTEAKPDGVVGSTKLIRACKCRCMKKMKPSVCSCDICEELADGLRRFNKLQKLWHYQAKDKRRCELIRTKEAENVSAEEMSQFLQSLKENDDQLLCDKCNGHCHPGKPYRTFSESPSTCRSALLCQKVSVRPLELPKLDMNFCQVIGETDTFEIEPRSCSYGNHVGFNSTAGGTTKRYQKCGWDGTFRDMPLREWEDEEEDPKTKETISNKINACPDDIDRVGKVIWMKFQKVARTSAKTTNADEDYGQGDGVNFQTEWLPVEGTPREFLIHLRACIDAYFPHKYEVKLSERVDYNAQRAFMIDPVTREDCPESYKDVVQEVCDFSTDIQGKRAHDATCSFPEMHKCEVHHLTFDPKFVSVDEIEKEGGGHKKAAANLRKRGVTRVLRNRNVVVYGMSKAKASAAYNQTVTSNIISIVKDGRLPDDSKCEAFMEGKRIPGGDRTGFPELPIGELHLTTRIQFNSIQFNINVISICVMSLQFNLNQFTFR